VGDIPYDAALTPSGGFLYIANYGDGTISAFSANQTTGALTEVTGSPFLDGDIFPAAAVVSPNGKYLFVANFSANNAGSISVLSINSSTGALTPITGSPFAGSGPPNGIAISPTGAELFIAATGVDAYSINATTGALTAVTGSPFATPATPYGATVDPTGKFLYASTFGSTAPNVVTFSINSSTGALSELSAQGVDGNQGEALAIAVGTKAVTYTPKFAYVTNQLDSTISEYTISDSTGALSAVSGSPISDKNAPQIVVATPSGAFVYTANNNEGVASISEYSVNATTGALTLVSGSPITGMSGIAAITVDPTSSYLLIAEGNNELIDTYSINPTSGKLTFVTSVAAPNKLSQWMVLDPTGIVLDYITSNSLDYYRVNNGSLVALASTAINIQTAPLGVASDQSSQYVFLTEQNENTITTYAMPILSSLSSTTTGNVPTFIVTEPSGKYVYVANSTDGTISAYSLNNATGKLTAIGTAIAAAANTDWLAVSNDGKYLFATDGGAALVSIYSIGSTGALTSKGTASTGNGPSSIVTTGTWQ
jgi:6-phosphogluconolactonase (cycloisomerase 2 family)